MSEAWQIALIRASSALFGGLLGGLLSGAYEHWRDWYFRPQLRIDYENDGPANKIVVDDLIYIRARVRNTGRRTAKGALVFLTSLEKSQPGGGVNATSFYDSM